LGLAALGTPLLLSACQSPGVAAAPTPTPTLPPGTLYAGDIKVQWMLPPNHQPPVTAQQMAAMALDYGTAVGALRAQQAQALADEIAMLQQVSTPYAVPFQSALKDEGIDAQKLSAALSAASRLATESERAAAYAQIQNAYGGSVQKALSAAQLDVGGVLQQVQKLLSDKMPAGTEPDPAVPGPWAFLIWLATKPTPPGGASSCSKVVHHGANDVAYMGSVGGGTVQQLGGAVTLVSSISQDVAASGDCIASVGWLVQADATGGHIHAETDVVVDTAECSVGGLGGAVARADLFLNLLSGTTVIDGIDQFLGSALLVVAGSGAVEAPGIYHLGLDFMHPGGAAATYTVAVSAYTSAAAGGLAGAGASVTARLPTGLTVSRGC
jgi:hypothetical protein